MSDNNLQSYYDRHKEVLFLPPIDARGHEPPVDDALKISASSHLMIFCGAIHGGREDCVDINNKSNGILVDSDFHPNGKYVATIKGGSSNILLRGIVHGHGTEVDIDIGNVSDQSDNLTTNVRLDLIHAKGEPITVRCIGGPRPILLNEGEQEYRVVLKVPGAIQSCVLKTWKFLKKIKILPLL